MRIVIAVEGTRGDVHPMLELAGWLMSSGHHVRICAPPDFEDVVQARGAEFWPVGRNIRELITDAAHVLHSRGLEFFTEVNRLGQESVISQFKLLPEATAGMDRVFAAGTVFAAASAAELNRIPFRYVTYTPAMLPSAEYTPALLPFQVKGRSANRLLWWMAHRLMGLMVGRSVNAFRSELGLAPVRDISSQIVSRRPIVAADRPLAPVPEDCRYDYDQIRCLHPLVGDPLPAKLESFLGQGLPPVFLGFGSMPDPSPQRTTRRLLEAIDRIGCRALIARGWAGLGDGPLPDSVMAVDPVSHASLFPRLAAVVHHGGAGTTHSAARAGVPQIIIPHILDQFYFARRVVDLGVGPPPIPRTQLNVDRLVETLRATLDNELLEERARTLAVQLTELGPVTADLDSLLR